MKPEDRATVECLAQGQVVAAQNEQAMARLREQLARARVAMEGLGGRRRFAEDVARMGETARRASASIEREAYEAEGELADGISIAAGRYRLAEQRRVATGRSASFEWPAPDGTPEGNRAAGYAEDFDPADASDVPF